MQQINRVSVPLQGEAEQLQSDQPPLCPSSHLPDDVCGEVHAHHLAEEGQNLLGRTTQLVGADFQHLPTCSQKRKRQGGIGARSQHDMQLGRKVLHQIGEGAVHLILGDQVIVVQDQEKLFGSARQSIDERLQDVAHWRLRRLQGL